MKVRFDTDRFVAKVILTMQGEAEVAGCDHGVVVLYDHLLCICGPVSTISRRGPTWFV